jgi:hypothetical protein
MVAAEGGVEGAEPVSPRARGGGEPLIIAGGVLARFWLTGSHSAASARSMVVWTVPLTIACST